MISYIYIFSDGEDVCLLLRMCICKFMHGAVNGQSPSRTKPKGLCRMRGGCRRRSKRAYRPAINCRMRGAHLTRGLCKAGLPASKAAAGGQRGLLACR